MSVNFFALPLGVQSSHVSSPLTSFLKEGREFIREFFESPETVGSLFPSSRFLAKAITKYIPQEMERLPQQLPLKILEVGAGTGPFTEEIIRKMSDKDELDIVENNPKFCKILKKKFSSSTKKITIHQKSITEWKPAAQYDYIISGLPFNIFPAKDVKEILGNFKILAKKDAKLSYFEYILIPRIYRRFLKRLSPKRENLLKILELKNKFFADFGFQKKTVLLNFTPARVLHFNMPEVATRT